MTLRVVFDVDRRAVLRADVVALPHALRRVMVLPEGAEQIVVRHARRVEHDTNDLRVTRATGANLTVRRVGRAAAGVADVGRDDAGELPELFLRAPEAAHRERGRLRSGGEGALERGAEDLVLLGDGDLRGTAGQRFCRGGNLQFVGAG